MRTDLKSGKRNTLISIGILLLLAIGLASAAAIRSNTSLWLAFAAVCFWMLSRVVIFASLKQKESLGQ
jgi:hypothetical protein